MALCKFIKFKTPEKAIADLEEVMKKKAAVPMTGEIPHKPGKGMMSGRYPVRAAEQFLILVKSLQSNANTNSMDEPVISEAVPNMAARPYGRFGRHRKKRTHVSLKVVEKKSLKELKKAKDKKVKRKIKSKNKVNKK